MDGPVVHIHDVVLIPVVVVGLIGPEINGVDVDNNPSISKVPCLAQQGGP